ncbi:MAG TPA: H-NS histone family protein [Paraburkholderia sp.]|jgi:DNA-binding protein H-NS
MATLEQIQARMKKLQAEAEAIMAKRSRGALDQIAELMHKHGLTTQDIEVRAKTGRNRAKANGIGAAAGKFKAVGATKGKLPPKYRDPKTGATWSGHARPPAWIKNVKDRTRFLIDAGSAAAEASVATKVKPAGKKAAAKKTGKAAKKVARKAVSAKAIGRKAAAKKVTAKRAAPASAKKAATKKVAAKKGAGRKSGRGAKPAVTSTKAVTVAPAAANGAVAMN